MLMLISESLGQDDVEALKTEVHVPSMHDDGLIVVDPHNFPE